MKMETPTTLLEWLARADNFRKDPEKTKELISCILSFRDMIPHSSKLDKYLTIIYLEKRNSMEDKVLAKEIKKSMQNEC